MVAEPDDATPRRWLVRAPGHPATRLADVVATACLLLLAAGVAGVEQPLRVLPGWPQARPDALVGLLLLAVALRLRDPQAERHRLLLSRSIALATAAVATLITSLNLSGIWTPATPRWVAGAILALLAITVAAGDLRRCPRATAALLGATTLALSPALLSYVLGSPAAFALTRATGISAPCAVLAALLLCAVAARLLEERRRGADDALVGQLVLRRVMPLLLGLPLLVRLLSQLAEHLGASAVEAEVLADVVMVALLGLALWSVVQQLGQRHEEQRARHVAEARFRVAFEETPIGVAILSPDGHVLDANPALGRLLQQSPVELAGVRLASLTHPDDLTAHEELLEELRRGERDTYDVRERYVRPDGTTVTAALHVGVLRDAEGGPVQLVAQVVDLTERLRFEHELQYAATHDPLSGLPNRRLLTDRLQVALADAARHQTRVGVLFVDLDDFKLVNDRHGHGVGDEVLRVVAQRLRASAREADTVARVGGDEFVVLTPAATPDGDLFRVEARLRDAVEQPIQVARTVVVPRVSIGSHLVDGATDPDTALSGADRRMYDAKRTRTAD